MHDKTVLCGKSWRFNKTLLTIYSILCYINEPDKYMCFILAKCFNSYTSWFTIDLHTPIYIVRGGHTYHVMGRAASPYM